MLKLIWGEEATEAESKPVVSEAVPRLTVETVNNHVYFYAGVDSDRVLALIREIRNLDAMLRSEHISRQLGSSVPLTPIWLHVNSGGGFLYDGFAAANQLQGIASPIYSLVEGYCASAATLISLSCTKRFILPNAFMLIHQLSNFMWGKYEEFKDEMKLLDMAMKQLQAFYASRTNLTKEEVEQLLKRESWFEASECLERGFVDEIWDGVK